jgi:hypothetical protein
MTLRSKISLSLLTALLLALLALAVGTPWKSLAEKQIEAALAAKGLGAVKVAISGIGPHSTVFDSISLTTAGAPLVLKNVTASYDPRALARKDFSTVTIDIGSAALSWKGGELTARQVHVAPASSPAAKFDVQIRHVSVDALLQALTGNRLSATGTVSGVLPVIVGADGALSFGKGTLKTDAPGTLNMPPESIPGDNPQVDQVRKVLKDFHYSGLSIAISSERGNRVSMLIALQGNNPGMYDGRPVNLNVSLTGDVLDYIKQNVLLLTDPKSFLKQEHP